MDPKARACFYVGPARNHPPESKRVLVDSGKVIVTRNVTWARLPFAYPITTQSKPPEEEEGEDKTEDREAGSVEVDSNCEERASPGHIGEGGCSPEHRGFEYHWQGFLRHGRQ